MSIFKKQVSSSSGFPSFFYVTAYNSSLIFQLIPFLRWTKRSFQSRNFDTSKCSGGNLVNFSRHFLGHESVFLQILHGTSVSWKITPLYRFRSSVIYIAWKGPIKVQIFENFWVFGLKIHQTLVFFETTNWFFFKIHIALQCHKT